MTKPTSDAARLGFIAAHAKLATPPLTPEIQLWLAAEATPLWEATEAFLEAEGLPPPFWAFAWAGGQALARYVMDNPELVRGQRVADFGAGGGIVAIAALKAGAISALAIDLDPFAAAATRQNGAANGVEPHTHTGDAIDCDASDFDVILAGDVAYERAQSADGRQWLDAAAQRGALVMIGDPGRTYLERDGLRALETYDVPTPMELEREPITPTTIWRIQA